MTPLEKSSELIYKTLLEIKEQNGRIESKVDSNNHRLNKIEVSHSDLKETVSKHKTYVSLATKGGSVLAVLISALTTWLINHYNGTSTNGH